jgi:hypothetical protein
VLASLIVLLNPTEDGASNGKFRKIHMKPRVNLESERIRTRISKKKSRLLREYRRGVSLPVYKDNFPEIPRLAGHGKRRPPPKKPPEKRKHS